MSTRTPRECLRVAEDHFAQLVASTLSKRHPVIPLRLRGGNRSGISFRNQSGPIGVPVSIASGKLYLFMWQLVVAEPIGDRQYTAVLRDYAYRLQEGPDLKEDRALIRWEYSAGNSTPSRYSRHHVQISATLQSSAVGSLDLNRVYLPSGWTTLESVIRFLVSDLGMRPPCGKQVCLRILDESEARLFEKFGLDIRDGD